ncbi:MAG: hypothetical protein AAFV53_07635 [Myxococcota bacterium]
MSTIRNLLVLAALSMAAFGCGDKPEDLEASVGSTDAVSELA